MSRLTAGQLLFNRTGSALELPVEPAQGEKKRHFRYSRKSSGTCRERNCLRSAVGWWKNGNDLYLSLESLSFVAARVHAVTHERIRTFIETL